MMGYFSNSTEHEIWLETNCLGCVHNKVGLNCPVIDAHHLNNYKDCNNPESILHILIPRNKAGGNMKCSMFHLPAGDRCLETPDMFGGK